MDRPILFSAPMVRALLDGRKTQTRRIIKPQPELTSTGHWHVRWQVGGGCFVPMTAPDGQLQGEILDGLRIQIGDRLWVREACCIHGDEVFYRVNEPGVTVGLGGFAKWASPIHMPRWASRVALTVTDVRVQRLQDISEEDARAEGMDEATAATAMDADEREALASVHMLAPHAYHRVVFETLWDKINGPASWCLNPWIAAYTFTVERRNIDALPSPAGEVR